MKHLKLFNEHKVTEQMVLRPLDVGGALIKLIQAFLKRKPKEEWEWPDNELEENSIDEKDPTTGEITYHHNKWSLLPQVDDNNFEDFVKEKKTFIIFCYATWCGNCQKMKPIIEQIAKDYFGKFTIGKLDVDKAKTIKKKFEIYGVPAVMVYIDGEYQDIIEGSFDRKDIISFIDEMLK